MNKARIDAYIPKAYTVLTDLGVAENGKISGTFRGYISSFGAAVTMGSLKAAIAFFSNGDNKAKKNRALLMDAIYAILEWDKKGFGDLLALACSCNDEYALKEEILNAAIAIKLAMNMYELEKNDNKKQ